MVKKIHEDGNTHVLIVVTMVVVLLSTLGFIFWRNVSSQNGLKSETSTKDDDSVETWKTYRSVTGSGLSFKYPSSWYFDTSANENDFGNGRKALVHLLTNRKLQTDATGITDGLDNEYMCVTLNELSGPWPYSYKPISDSASTDDFSDGATTLSLITSQEFGNMQVVSKSPVGKHGISYLPLAKEYFVLVTAQYSCYGFGGSAHANLKDKPEYEQAKTILKSIKLNDI